MFDVVFASVKYPMNLLSERSDDAEVTKLNVRHTVSLLESSEMFAVLHQLRMNKQLYLVQ